ncbi:transcription antitermination factor NusB [Clostridium algidicarnis]|uniref:Transcription antitermination protein NusB n=1 Tax=Clostridium algidicarnis DSM 15099 TaxID=1121295 RepID=A0A2S6G1J9_9CLOT|nr:transcription antitermination factor NusB [Clostridium algidicarnis]MBU3193807.1 transcription antitermination factor NusB [Clostridium algidicarnis]MBU3203312.1 transcription antitermination factor NusB [Clostridium algidicarnis]MBU3205393.1 transcription antitermination factor NusB [Clostridium algidicarnis]MBU3211466.1 transcription antitermination factor NusB [Clostridium algidicarnis]MBU3222026.1 transcription antitermination factor NusB [Clostridium algidicarnis]
MNRKRSRETALELTFQMMINKESSEETIENFIENTDYDINELDLDYIKLILKGIDSNKEKLDTEIEKYMVNWKLQRISKIDHAILRIGCYEILLLKDVPYKVAINEALELTRKYSDEKSISFINGILDNINKNK